MTILMGVVANFPLALATGLGLNAFVAFSIASQMTWADAMGLVVIEGLVILVLVLTGFREAVFHAVPAPAQDRDHGRHRPVHRAHRLRRRRLRAPHPRRRQHHRARSSSAGGAARRLAGLVFVVGLLLVIALCVRKVKGAILIAIVATTVARDRRRGDRRARRRRRQPDRLGRRAGLARRLVEHPGLRHRSASSTCSAPSSASASSPRCC